MSFAENLREMLSKKGMTQTNLAKELKVTRASVNNWVTGRSNPTIDGVAEIARVLGVSEASLIGKNNRIPFGSFYPEATSATVPLVSFGAIHAGDPIEPIRDDVMVEVPAAVAEAHPSGYLLQVVGNCMNRRYPKAAMC